MIYRGGAWPSDAFTEAHEAFLRNEEILTGLPDPVSPGIHRTYLVTHSFGGKIIEFEFHWAGDDRFTFVMDETFFDSAFEGEAWWGEVLRIAWRGGHLEHDEEIETTSSLPSGLARPTTSQWWFEIARSMFESLLS